MVEVTSRWVEKYPEAMVGVLAMDGVKNPLRHQELEDKKEALENALRSRYSSDDRRSLRSLPVLAAYHDYYQMFGNTYHVQHQLETVAFKQKPIPQVSALVLAMFMAELDNLLLTAGHDLDATEVPLRICVADGSETYIRMNGEDQALKPEDMIISDQAGTVSSILYGPDKRTRIKPGTQRVVFTVYIPPVILREQVHHHLQEIQSNVTIVAPQSTVTMMEIFGTD